MPSAESQANYRVHILPVLQSVAFRRYCLSLTRGNDCARDDLVQDVALKSWRLCDAYDPDLGTPKAWVATVARNTWYTTIQARKRMPSDPASWLDAGGTRGQIVGSRDGTDQSSCRVFEDVTHNGGSPESQLDDVRDWQYVADKIADLPQAQAQAITDHYMDGLEDSEAGEVRGCHKHTCATRRIRGLAAVRAA